MKGDYEKRDSATPDCSQRCDSDISRRTWISTISQAAMGFSLSSGLKADTNTLPQLPPGVYLPSKDHLGHALMSAGRFHVIPPSCPTDYVRPATEPFTPQFFSGSEFAVLRRLIQLMLDAGSANLMAAPTEEIAEWVDLKVLSAAAVREAASGMDPLHRALAAAYFGSARANLLETAKPENISREGLDWLAHAARAQGADHFLSLNEDQQLSILHSISDERADKHTENPGTRFFAFLKAEVIRGFYTSQVGLKEIDFKGNAFYARSPGCESRSAS